MLRGQIVKLFRARPALGHPRPSGAPGTVLGIGPRGLEVAASDGVVEIREVQAAGRKRMTGAQFAAGRGIAIGDVLARPEPA